MVSELRSAGWLDWHILSAVVNIAINARHPIDPRSNISAIKPKIPEPEKATDAPLCIDLFSVKSMYESLNFLQLRF